jgi:hypothetical protein
MIDASGTTAADSSTTVPLMVAVAAWAAANVESLSAQATTVAKIG